MSLIDTDVEILWGHSLVKGKIPETDVDLVAAEWVSQRAG